MMRRERRASTYAALLVLPAIVACAAPSRSSDTVVYASGADLESANPLVTVHPLSRQVQRYVLFVTLLLTLQAVPPVRISRRCSFS